MDGNYNYGCIVWKRKKKYGMDCMDVLYGKEKRKRKEKEWQYGLLYGKKEKKKKNISPSPSPYFCLTLFLLNSIAYINLFILAIALTLTT